MKRRKSGSSSAAQRKVTGRRSPSPHLMGPATRAKGMSASVTRDMDAKPSMRPSLLVLSAVWLALCSCLVWKEQRLSQIFFSFCGCFGAAAALHRIFPCAAASAAAVPTAVGVLDCGAALLACASRGRPYAALSLVAGYLAFDQWYTALRLTMELSWRVVEDALALSTILVVLATLKDESSLEHVSFKIQVWIVYKLAFLLVRLVRLPRKLKANVETGRSHRAKLASLAAKSSPPPSTLWTIHGVDYDLAEFVSRHPGGEQAILLGRGRDCTALFESYHPFTNQHRAVLQRYRRNQAGSLTSLTNAPSPSDESDLPSAQRDEFYRVLCERVARTLRDNGIDPIRDRAATFQRSAYYLGIVVCVLVSGWAHVRGRLLGSVGFAAFGWLLGALGHDAGHFCASRSAAVNERCVWAMGLLANPVVWQHQHTYAHHSHTNSFQHDPDLHHFETLLRVHRSFPLRDRYRVQSNAAFVVFAWALVVVGTCFWIPWGVLRSSTLYGMIPVSRPLGMWIHFGLYFGVVMVAPYFSHDTLGGATAAVLAHVFTSGLLFAFFSQINHLNERSLEPSIVNPSERTGSTGASSLASSWAKIQVEASNNFAPDSRVWHVLSNGLNLQIEHHLFPGLNHCHLHRIAPTVRRTCEEHGVRYKSYAGWRDIAGATLEWLDRLSREP